MHTAIITSSSSWRHSWLVRAAGALLAFGAIAAIPAPAQAGVSVSINIAPPILPIYAQPIIPGSGYLWTPGYWAWGGDSYYWVPGTWVLPPFVGALWTPGYWGWGGGIYVFHRGYWGRHVGFYGGIDYGYGYGGRGYEGGYWRNGGFYYNRSVNHVSVNIRNVYNRTVINNNTTRENRRVSFNGGSHGTTARATAAERGWVREQRQGPVAAQLQQRNMASRTRSQRASVNHGTPPIAATARAGAFRGHDVTAARDAPNARATPAVSAAHQSPRNDGAMRSASFAPHGNHSVGSTNAARHRPSMQQRSRAVPGESSRVARGAENRPQDVRAASDQPRAQRPQIQRRVANDAHANNGPANERPNVARTAPSRGRSAPVKRGQRRDDKQHR